jgi:hypothetical protein
LCEHDQQCEQAFSYRLTIMVDVIIYEQQQARVTRIVSPALSLWGALNSMGITWV